MLSAIIGGTAAELGGGKFANGAISAAFLRLYNDESDNLARLFRGEKEATLSYASSVMDHILCTYPNLKTELAGTIDRYGNVHLGPKSDSLTRSSPGKITEDTVVVFHFHPTGPNLRPYQFSDYRIGPKNDLAFMERHSKLIHMVGVLDAAAGKNTIFYRAPNQPFAVRRPTQMFYDALKGR